MINNKHGWIKIVEAFIAVLLIAGVLLFVINRGYIGKSDISDRVYQAQIAILREIELDENLRTQILSAELEGDVPQDVLNKIEQRKPDYLTCVAKICKMDVLCESGEVPLDKDIYSQPVAITTDSASFDPRQLKLFCWTD